MTESAIWRPTIIVPKYAAPGRRGSNLRTPPSPPSERRIERESALRRALRTFTGRLPENWQAIVNGGLVNGGMVNQGHAMVNAGIIRAHTGGPSITAPTAFYRLADLADSSGNGFTLTDAATATFGAGKIGDCCNNFDQSHGLYRNDSADFQPAGHFSVWGWANASFLGPGGNRFLPIVGKWNYAGSKEFAFGYDTQAFLPSNGWAFVVSSDGTTVGASAQTSSASTGTWYFVAAWYDGTNINLSVNGGTIVQAAFSANVFNGPEIWAVGRAMDGWRGSLDAISWWNGYAVTSAEVTAGYNGTGVAAGTEYYSGAWH